MTDRDHILGSASAPVTLVEYGDYECPFCGAAHQVVKELICRLGDRMAYVFRHFPLTRMHPHAQMAAESAEAAGAQGRFWPMHDVLFTNQRALDEAHLVSYAAQVGLDVDRFTRELAAGVHAPRVREDFMSGVRSGVNGTPTFFINGRRHDGDYDLVSLLEAMSAAAATRGAPVNQGGLR